MGKGVIDLFQFCFIYLFSPLYIQSQFNLTQQLIIDNKAQCLIPTQTPPNRASHCL